MIVSATPGVSGNGFADYSGFSGFGGLGDIFEEFFSGFGTGGAMHRTQRGPRRGADLRHDMELTFEEAVFGCEKDILVPRHEACPRCGGTGAEPGSYPTSCPDCRGTGEVRRVQQSILGSFVNVGPCPSCRGEGTIILSPCTECKGQKQVRRMAKLTVTVPPGVDEGTQLRLAGEGERGSNGGPAGNLYVVFSVKPHPHFIRRDSDLHLELPMNFAQAALGDKVQIPTLEGKDDFIIPAGTQTGKTFRLKGRGVPHVRGQGRGDLMVTIRVVTPTHLNDQQRDLMRQLGETLGEEVIPQNNRGFFERMIDALGDAFKA